MYFVKIYICAEMSSFGLSKCCTMIWRCSSAEMRSITSNWMLHQVDFYSITLFVIHILLILFSLSPLLLASLAEIIFSLVDHNENKELTRLLPRGHFEEIVDHHQPTFADGACQVADQSRVLIDTTVGSCSSLVALRFLDCPLISKFGARQEVNTDEAVALLLYGPILLGIFDKNKSLYF